MTAKKRKTRSGEDSPAPAKKTRVSFKAAAPRHSAKTEVETRSILGSSKNLLGDEVEHSKAICTFQIPFRDDKLIVCERHGSSHTECPPDLIFTHGAGGGISNPGTREFAAGFGEGRPVVCFQGVTNLKSRVDTFRAVISDQWTGCDEKRKHPGTRALGGQSMGARAAVIAANDDETEGRTPVALVLVGYPLIGGSSKKAEDVRDQILYNLPAHHDVLFISGSNDAMCPIPRLQQVIERMKQNVWLIEVEGADHGMNIKRKERVPILRKEIGRLAAQWVQGGGTFGKLSKHLLLTWNEDGERFLTKDSLDLS